jgi:hypothetical protein
MNNTAMSATAKPTAVDGGSKALDFDPIGPRSLCGPETDSLTTTTAPDALSKVRLADVV